MAVADERDALAPQLEEAKWRARQADKDKAELQAALKESQAVCLDPNCVSTAVVQICRH